jgi:hypothetical protein
VVVRHWEWEYVSFWSIWKGLSSSKGLSFLKTCWSANWLVNESRDDRGEVKFVRRNKMKRKGTVRHDK